MASFSSMGSFPLSQVESFMSMVGVGLQVIEEVYPELMKLRWS